MSQGIKEFKELLTGIEKLTLLLIVRFKDGVTADDLTVIMTSLATDPDFIKAVTGLKELPAEFKDFSMTEGLEVGMMVMQSIPKYVNAFKK